jgi:AraC-like DNA-binding protein
LRDVTVSSASATSILLTRSKRHVGSDGKSDIQLLLCDGARPIAGGQFGREHVLREGDALVMDFAAPHVSGAPAGAKALAVHVQRAALERIGGFGNAVGGSLVDHRVEAMQLLRGYVRLMLSGSRPITDAVAAASSRHIIELVALALGSAQPEREETGSLDAVAAARVALLINEITVRFAEPALDAAAVGKSLGLSERSVQYLLQRAGTTFSDELREARLVRADAMLGSTAHLARSIAAIAFECGFTDLSTFYRAFRARFGMTPGDRRGARAL